MRDYLGDLIIRIKNAQNAGLPEVIMHPYMPKRYLKILDLLYQEGYLRGYMEQYDSLKGHLVTKVFLKYSLEGTPIIENIFKISAPGRRIYVSTKTLWKPKNGKGVFLLSTTKGFLSDRDARLLNVGGELLLGVY